MGLWVTHLRYPQIHGAGAPSGFKRPRELVLVDEIPKTPAGKVQKPKLRDEYLARNSVGQGR